MELEDELYVVAVTRLGAVSSRMDGRVRATPYPSPRVERFPVQRLAAMVDNVS